MRVLITCGPSYEPLDRVRRLTNSSTGKLGVDLAERLAGVGAAVVCLKGSGATSQDPAPPVVVEHFTTNDDLAERLRRWAGTGAFAAVFQVAALCDFRITRVENPDGRIREEGKLPSHGSELCVHLSPTHKLITDLVELFPEAWVVGWKYEVDGTVADAVRKGQRQMEECGTHACVVNGPACGSQWFLCELPDQTVTLTTRQELILRLTERIQSRFQKQ
jgi:phosphopantothenoylcysteine decarboxylase/phosphopantothenate--cysteine ligase